jgi:lysine/arginine/ornithine transport system substrate-binding protein
MKKYPLHALAAVLGVAGFVLVAHAAQTETLRFGTDPSYPPYEYKLPSGQLAGLDIDLGNALCAAAHVKCEWVEGSFDGLIAGLQSRKFDAINASLAATAARRAVMDFTTPLYPARCREEQPFAAECSVPSRQTYRRAAGLDAGCIREGKLGCARRDDRRVPGLG